MWVQRDTLAASGAADAAATGEQNHHRLLPCALDSRLACLAHRRNSCRQTHLPSLFAQGDELALKGIPPATIIRFADTVRASFPRGQAIIYYNEASFFGGPRHTWVNGQTDMTNYTIPKSLDWFGVDLYHYDGPVKGWAQARVGTWCKRSRSLCVFFRGASNTRLHRPGECVSEHQRAAEGGPCSRRVRVDREPLSEWYIRVRPSVLRRDVHARRSRILCVGKERREGRGDCSVELGRLPRLQRQPLDAAEYVLYGRDRREGPAEDPRGVGADWGRDQERPQSIEDRRARAPAGASALGLRTRECSNGRLGLRLLPI